MFALERLRIIRNIMMEQEQVEVNTLSQMLNVSEVTIRRDLIKLEQEGFLQRTHGGAILSSSEKEILPPLDEDDLESDEIASIACHMISDGDVIMLTNGSINKFVAKKIVDKKHVTILTNDIYIALNLSASPNIKVVLLGGNIDFNQKAVYGSLTISTLQRFYVNKIFIEVEGLTEQMQFTSQSLEKANLIQEASLNAKEKIVVCKSSAFKNAAFYTVAPLSFADKIVTSTKIPDECKQIIFDEKIKLYTSVNLLEGSV